MIGKLGVGDICTQGLPFYSGSVTYKVPLPDGVNRLRLPEIGGACAKINGQILGWDPFEADIFDCRNQVDIEVILTRRNTFGPLHDVLDPRGWICPQHFVTENSEYCGNPMLIPSGLLQSPAVATGC